METPVLLFQATGLSLQVCFTDAALVAEAEVLRTRINPHTKTPRTNPLQCSVKEFFF
jgi:hypothetical protein